MLASALFAGQLVGASPWGAFGDLFGRRWADCMVCCWALLFFSQDYQLSRLSHPSFLHSNICKSSILLVDKAKHPKMSVGWPCCGVVC